MVQELLASRVSLTPRPVQKRTAALEVAFLGHCPGRVRLDRLLNLADALSDMRNAGFGESVDALLSDTADAGTEALYHLPVPLRSSAEFHDIFPDAAREAAVYRSTLAGDRAWLAPSVDDYFAHGGLQLWIVRIPEADGQHGFFPAPDTDLHDARTLRGLATLLVIPSVGTVACPDLERLQVPPRLPEVPPVQLANPDPQFLPCTTDSDDDQGERRPADELPVPPDPLALETLLPVIMKWLSLHRRDMQWLFTLPLAYSNTLDAPRLDPAAITTLNALKKTPQGHRLRQLQCVFPYLRGPRYTLRSAVGAVAGLQAGTAQRQGIWSSIADKPFNVIARPYPTLSIAETVALRSRPGLSVFRHTRDQIRLDDERLPVPALPAADIKTTVNDPRYDGYRSAEIQRFLGYLQRALRALGEQLLFSVDYRDPRPRLLLEQFFRRLQARGALRGRTPGEAFNIRQINASEGIMLFEIEIAPALPIEKLVLTFSNADGTWNGGSLHV